MTEPLARSPRQVSIADHLWETLSVISRDMGVDRDGLINQALFAFARQQGYLAPAVPPRASAAADAPMSATVSAFVPVTAPVPPSAPAPAPVVAAAPAPAPAPEPEPEPEPEPMFVEPPAPAPAPPIVASPARPSIPPHPLPSSAAAKHVSSLTVDPVVFEDPLPPLNAPMPSLSEGQIDVAPPAPEPEPEPALQLSSPDMPAAAANIGTLVIYAEGRAVDKVTAPRFLIGRGKHCDLIINSGKVSREHAAIVREGDDYFIEDLGSSNGTWYDKKRITRRKIDNGDEYFVCSEKITCRFE